MNDMLRCDGLGVCVAGGALSVQTQVQEYAITPDEVVHANCWLVSAAGNAESSLVNPGRPNPNTSSSGNPDAVRLGAEIGGHVMGQAEWEVYTTTPTTEMAQVNWPMAQAPSQKLAKKRDSRRGWVFCDATHLGAR